MNERFTNAREKYLNGDKITDSELGCLCGYYRRVYETVSEYNEPCYKLVWKDALEKYNELDRIIQSRASRLTDDGEEKLAILDRFVEKLTSSQVELDAESQKMLNENFWDLLA
jgi:hypothetical protein